MAIFKTKDGLLEVEVSEMDVNVAVDYGKPEQPEPVDYIILTVKSPETDAFSLKLEFWPQDAIDLGKEIAKQGKSAKND